VRVLGLHQRHITLPPGLLIGTITSVTSDPNAVVQSATVAPAAHLTDATFLLVITDYKGGFGPALPSASAAASGLRMRQAGLVLGGLASCRA